jgi:ribosomal protein S18 acetylase RimI-like enzyme
MIPADVEPASAAVLVGGWGERRSWFAHAVGSERVRSFVATDPSGGVVGTGVATINGPAAWIGTIWVDETWRGRGLGRRLTEASIEAAEDAGCQSLLLVATDQGRVLYERLGFTIAAWYVILEAPGLGETPGLGEGSATRRIRPWRDDDLDRVAEIDARATGEDRRHLLAAFGDPRSAHVIADDDDRCRAFLVRPPWGGGATIAEDPDDALALLRERRRTTPADRRVRAGLIDSNAAGIARLTDDGWTEAWRAPRMHRGVPVDWRPDRIWGQFNFALG